MYTSNLENRLLENSYYEKVNRFFKQQADSYEDITSF